MMEQMTWQDVENKAREVLAPKCKVCPDCNGVACKGQIPGVGAIGDGSAFTVCREYLKSIKIMMDFVHEDYEVDSSIELFGRRFEVPFFVAPIGGMPFNYTNYMTEAAYAEATVLGAAAAGTLAFTGDGPLDDYFPSTLPAIEKAGGLGVSTIKPWAQDKVMQRIAELNRIGCVACAMDIDSAALINLKLKGKPAYAKSEAELREIVEAANMPFIVKGVMTPASAARCAAAGAYGIVVSTHGGRIMQDFPAPCAMMPAIREAVGDSVKIFVDGGIRSGADVFKCLALGADAVLIGRPYAIAAHGGGQEGVRLYTEKIAAELRETMRAANCRTLKDIHADCIWQG